MSYEASNEYLPVWMHLLLEKISGWPTTPGNSRLVAPRRNRKVSVNLEGG